jgi:SAM-dependent methyltransferase
MGPDRLRDNPSLHKFLWSRHLAYAVYYDVPSRLDAPIEQSREVFFRSLDRRLPLRGGIESVLEVGCSLGYNLRYLERQLPRATALHGLDIDRYAVRAGNEYLRRIGSLVELREGDMERLESVLAGRSYDLVYCCGVLMYLEPDRVLCVVTAMLNHAKKLAAFAEEWSDRSPAAQPDGAYYHDLEPMIREATHGDVDCEIKRNVHSGRTMQFLSVRPPA